jgi:hypothetical protein
MNSKFNKNYSSNANKNFSVYGGKNGSGLSEKEEALRIARDLQRKNQQSKKQNVEEDNDVLKNKKPRKDVVSNEPEFEEISNEELKRRLEYAAKKNIEVINAGLNEKSDLTETIESIVNDLFN